MRQGNALFPDRPAFRVSARHERVRYKNMFTLPGTGSPPPPPPPPIINVTGPAATPPAPPPLMPDPMAPEAVAAQRQTLANASARSGRSSTILTTAATRAPRTLAGTYGASTLGGS